MARSGAAPPGGANGWVTLLATSLREEQDYQAATRGRWPDELQGSLFRNGPGLFERAGRRKNYMTEGDGMIRAYDIAQGNVHFRSKFVQTTKFREEEALGRYKYATWGSRAPGGFLRNLGGGKRRSEAEATVYVRHGKLLAFDEVGLPWALDPATLRTISRYQIGEPANRPAFKTRTKLDPLNGDWTVIGNDYVEPLKVRVIIENAQGLTRTELGAKLPRKTYFRDFFVTTHYVVIPLNAVKINTVRAALGLVPLIDSILWAPEIGNLAIVIPKSGDDPFVVEAPPSWSFHTINAFERGDEIVCDFIGYDSPEWLLGRDSALSAVMRGEIVPVHDQGSVRRWCIDVPKQTLREETLDAGPHEYPTIDPLRLGLPYSEAYLATSRPGQWWTSGFVRLNVETGARDAYEGNSTQKIGEPVFVPREGGGTDEGWVLVEELNGATGLSSLLLFDAAHIANGPIAEATLRHHLPVSIQGTWMAAR